MSTFTIIDPRPVAAEAPYTFFLPSTEEIEAIEKGDLVKLSFEYNHVTEEWPVERMWVTILDAAHNELSGRLENQPLEKTTSLKVGDLIRFQRHHILAVQSDRPEKASTDSDTRKYFERCLVDECVLDGSEPVEYIYRDTPDMQKKDDIFADSGWRVRGRMGRASGKEIAARKAQYVAVGAVLNRDDSWLYLLDAPIGSRFMRDFVTGIYETER